MAIKVVITAIYRSIKENIPTAMVMLLRCVHQQTVYQTATDGARALSNPREM